MPMDRRNNLQFQEYRSHHLVLHLHHSYKHFHLYIPRLKEQDMAQMYLHSGYNQQKRDPYNQ